MALDPSDVWSWQGGTGVTLFSGEGILRIVVGPAHYTGDLLDSDARCPDLDTGDFTIHFALVFDVFSGDFVAQDIACPDSDGD